VSTDGRRVLAGIFAGYFLACGSGGSTTSASNLSWRGARVDGTGGDVAVLEAAWQQMPHDWEPDGWQIIFRDGLIPCTDAANGQAGGCRGVTKSRRVIELSRAAGPTLQSVAHWELSNGRCWDLARRFSDEGWQCPV
jgi:hypothetical protein